MSAFAHATFRNTPLQIYDVLLRNMNQSSMEPLLRNKTIRWLFLTDFTAGCATESLKQIDDNYYYIVPRLRGMRSKVGFAWLFRGAVIVEGL